MYKNNIIGIIPARLDSQRLSNKMLTPILGKPLIQWTYENALKCDILNTLIIATDSQEIYTTAKSFGAEVILTGRHNSGSDRCAEVITKHPKAKECDLVVNIQGDEPDISPKVLKEMIYGLENDAAAHVSTACIKISTAEDALNPSNVKCVFNKNRHALYFSRAMIPFGKTGEFKSEISYYKHFGIYAFRKNCLLHLSQAPATPLQKAEDLEQLKLLELGYTIKIIEAYNDSLGIDTQEDLEKFIKMRMQR